MLETFLYFFVFPMFSWAFWLLPIIAFIAYRFLKSLALSLAVTVPVSITFFVIYYWGDNGWFDPDPILSGVMGVTSTLMITGFLWICRYNVRKIRRMMYPENGQVQPENQKEDIPPQ